MSAEPDTKKQKMEEPTLTGWESHVRCWLCGHRKTKDTLSENENAHFN